MSLFRFIALMTALGHVLASPTHNAAPRAEKFTPELFNDMKHNAQHAGAVYCNVETAKAGDLIKCSGGGCPSLEKNKVVLVDTFSGLSTGMGGYVAVDNTRGEIILTLRGTTNIRNLLTDIAIPMVKIDNVVPGGKAHAGFVKAWAEVADRANAALAAAFHENPTHRLTIVGHSLGAATASLAAASVRKQYPGADLFTYGSPRVGNSVLAEFLDAQGGGNYRVEHYNDAAANILPKFLGYQHTNTEYWLSVGPNTKVDYDFAQVIVCKGDNDGECSRSMFPDLTGTAHRYILSDLYACGGLQFVGIIH